MTLLKVIKGRDVILSDTSEFSAQLDLIDFNGDDGLDIMINFMGNVDTQSLYLLDKTKNDFKKIKNFDKYPAAKKGIKLLLLLPQIWLRGQLLDKRLIRNSRL